jgi:hypothetical protein
MVSSKIIKSNQTSNINKCELNYHKNFQTDEASYGSLAKLSDGRRNIVPLLPHVKGKILELRG